MNVTWGAGGVPFLTDGGPHQVGHAAGPLQAGGEGRFVLELLGVHLLHPDLAVLLAERRPRHPHLSMEETAAQG